MYWSEAHEALIQYYVFHTNLDTNFCYTVFSPKHFKTGKGNKNQYDECEENQIVSFDLVKYSYP